MRTRNYIDQAADALVNAYASINRPGVNFMDLLVDKGLLPSEPVRTGAVEKSIRGLFGAVGMLADKTGAAWAAMDRGEVTYFDLLETRGLLPASYPVDGLTLVFANDNTITQRTGGGDRGVAA